VQAKCSRRKHLKLKKLGIIYLKVAGKDDDSKLLPVLVCTCDEYLSLLAQVFVGWSPTGIGEIEPGAMTSKALSGSSYQLPVILLVSKSYLQKATARESKFNGGANSGGFSSGGGRMACDTR